MSICTLNKWHNLWKVRGLWHSGMGLESKTQDFGFATECDCRQVTLSHCNLCFVTGALFYIPASGFRVPPKMSAQF